jgi:hypothetical protein
MYLAVDHTGKMLFVADYGSGRVAPTPLIRMEASSIEATLPGGHGSTRIVGSIRLGADLTISPCRAFEGPLGLRFIR